MELLQQSEEGGYSPFCNTVMMGGEKTTCTADMSSIGRSECSMLFQNYILIELYLFQVPVILFSIQNVFQKSTRTLRLLRVLMIMEWGSMVDQSPWLTFVPLSRSSPGKEDLEQELRRMERQEEGPGVIILITLQMKVKTLL